MGRSVAVVGAGITGTVLALRLARQGHQVHLIEGRGDPRHALDGDRSINLALSHRGLRSLEAAGLRDGVEALGVPMRGRMIHDQQGRTSFQRYGTEPHHRLLSVSRLGFNQLLVDACRETAGIELSFDQRVTDVDPDTGEVETRDAGDRATRRRYDTVFGADGAYSAVRQQLQRRPSFDFEQDFLDHGYKELTVPADGSGRYVMEPEALHIWPRHDHMLIALPNLDRSFTGTVFWPLEPGEDATAPVDPAVFRRNFPDAAELMPDLDRELAEHPVGTLVTTRSHPWNVDDRVLLMGDAAHAVVPFYGQGANAALEDVRILAEMLGSGADWHRVFDEFARRRKPDADALAQLALDNYVEMRHDVTSPWFRARQRFERTLARLLPHHFQPLYTMVTFTSTPYAEAVTRARRQSRLAVVVAALMVVIVALVALGVFVALR